VGAVKFARDAANLTPMSIQSSPYRGYRFPPEIISYAVWLYHLFCLSFRDVEELLAERGITVSYEAVRQWGLKFGREFARELRHPRLTSSSGSVSISTISSSKITTQ
jgi:putative transposase